MNKWERKLWFKKNRGKLIKRGTILLSVILLIVGVIYITYSKFESKVEFTLINGKVVTNGDIQIISYEYDGEKKSIPPSQSDGYMLTNLECSNADGEWDDLNWKLTVKNITGKAKCNLEFSKTSNYKIVEFNANGGLTEVKYKKVQSGSQIGELPEPQKNASSFTGWYTDATNGTKVESTTTITNDMTLYAHWFNEEDVIFDANNGGMLPNSVAGGWYVFNDDYGYGSSVSNSSIYLNAPSQNGCWGDPIVSNKAINYADYSSMRIYVSTITSGKGGSVFQGQVSGTGNNNTNFYNRTYEWAINKTGWMTINLSSINNTGYIVLATTQTANINITYVSLIRNH